MYFFIIPNKIIYVCISKPFKFIGKTILLVFLLKNLDIKPVDWII